MKKHRGPLSMMSELESIDEGQELSDKQKSSSLEEKLVMGKDYTEEKGL